MIPSLGELNKMHYADFIRKLRKINPDIYPHEIKESEKLGRVGLYWVTRRKGSKYIKDANAEERKFLEEPFGQFLGACPLGDIPEKTIENKNGTIFKKGWKALLKSLINAKVIDKAKTLKVFDLGDI